MREALELEQKKAAHPGTGKQKKRPNLVVLLGIAFLLVILFVGALAVAIHALFNTSADEGTIVPTPQHDAHAESNPRPAEPHRASPITTLVILDENDPPLSEAPVTAIEAEIPSTPEQPSPEAPDEPPLPTVVHQPPEPAPAQQDNPAVRRWIDQISISGVAGNRMILDQIIYSVGDTVNPALGIRWTRVDPQQRVLVFTDRSGRDYSIEY